MTRHYATVCHRWQLPVLLDSMIRHCKPFTLHVLAWDWDPPCCIDRGPQWEDKDDWTTEYTPRDEFLARNPHYRPEVLPGRRRSPVDVVATVRWAFFADVMRATGAPLTAVDGDVWFWSSPEDYFSEIGDAKLAVTPHGIPPASFGLPGVTLETHRRFGLYNSGFTHMGDPFIAEMLARANREWSYSDPQLAPDGTWNYGDQGHLERLAQLVLAHVVVHPGVNAAPWNIHQRGLEVVDGVVRVGGRQLVAYHYSSTRFDAQFRMVTVADPGYQISGQQAEVLYIPYQAAMLRHAPVLVGDGP